MYMTTYFIVQFLTRSKTVFFHITTFRRIAAKYFSFRIFTKATFQWDFHVDPSNSFYVKLLTNGQTNKRRVKHNLLGGGNNG